MHIARKSNLNAGKNINTMSGNRSQNHPRPGITLQASSHGSGAYHQGKVHPTRPRPIEVRTPSAARCGYAWAAGLPRKSAFAAQAATLTTSPHRTGEAKATVRHYEVATTNNCAATATMIMSYGCVTIVKSRLHRNGSSDKKCNQQFEKQKPQQDHIAMNQQKH